MAANPQYAAGEVIANKYVVEGLLGESPAARTFFASGNTGKLAVKFYRPEVSARLLAAPDFFLKAGVMTEIEHDNLCACLDVQEEMGLVFVARAFADGESLEDWIRKHRQDGNYFSRGLEILWQTCQGLATLHERSRHLNIHPGNVMVGPLVAKLCDWDPRVLGNTEMTPDPLPVRSEYQGYRAPEAAGRNGFLSYPSTDLFAVAGMLYRLVKGEHPSVNPAQTLGEIRAFDKDLAVFLTKAMHPRPEERFQDANAFSDALWELGGAMGRLQERNLRSQPSAAARPAPEPAPRKPETFFPETQVQPDPVPAPAPAAKETTLFSAPKPAGNDTFFNFFPPADETPARAADPTPNPVHNTYQAPPAKPSGDTLFGAPAFASAKEPAKPVPDTHDFGSFGADSGFADPPKSGMSGLEGPGTLFGTPSPLFSAPSRQAPRHEPPPPAKPLAVSLSSLEKDPLEMAGSGEPGGFTEYGFKGAGDNRTGIYNPEGQAAATKTKLMILLGTVGILVLILGLGGLFLYLRSNAAQKVEPTAETIPEAPEPERPAPAIKEAAPVTQAVTPPPRIPDAKPYPDAEPESQPEPAAAQSAPAQKGYTDPPMPIEPARPDADRGNGRISPEREAALLAMVKTRTWPATAAECLKAADELNDLGKLAEANMAYSKSLIAAGKNERQKILAFGGLAVTFEAMGMRDQARDAVDQILAINPRNGFALKLKGKLK